MKFKKCVKTKKHKKLIKKSRLKKYFKKSGAKNGAKISRSKSRKKRFLFANVILMNKTWHKIHSIKENVRSSQSL